MQRRLACVGQVVLLLLALGSSSKLLAAVYLCNYSSHNIDIAFVFEHPQQRGNWVSAGWKVANSGQCINMINSDVRQINPNIYFYAISQDGSGYSWAGQQSFCIKRGQPFTIFHADRNCAGGEWQGFRWHNVHSNAANYTITIHD